MYGEPTSLELIQAQNKAAELEMKKAQQMKEMGLNPDGSPIRPEFQSMIDPATGKLMTQYQLTNKTLDPSTLAGYNMIKELATSTGPSAYAKAQQEQVKQNRIDQINAAAEQGAGALAQTKNTLAMRGGYSAGGATNLGRQSMKDILMAKQGAYGAQNKSLLDIGAEDARMKQGMLKDFATAEGNIAGKNLDLENQANQYNVGNLLKEKDLGRTYEMDTYKAALDKWGATEQAKATRSSGGGGGGCCFIFMEARYGNGVMDSVVRRFRDEKMTARNQRGYYKLSEVLVPLMRKSKLVKLAVRAFMTDPLVAYGKAYYGGNKIGFLFKPVTNFWLKMFDYLGQDHKFIRWNGEEI